MRRAFVNSSDAINTVPWNIGCYRCASLSGDLFDNGPMMSLLAAIGQHFERDHEIDLIEGA